MTKSLKTNRTPYFTGPNVYVPISNRSDRWAIIDRVDFYHLQQRSIDVTKLPWFVNRSGRGVEYVRVKIPGVGVTQLSRLIMGEPPHNQIKHLNNDRLDFRRANLGLLDSEDVRRVYKQRLPQPPLDNGSEISATPAG